ncbi:Ankyrin repeat-containing domain protein [Akanthomyces lecanii RCEF 1005]|uniref:Ankyrin repeat-containing domain protein n=1 Tax=Akanthomyces lecanii RCEF 1005 TaxID=1081108 RepID=A0A162JZD6_CORDF|nr:Ankyrin repeat-containing domain protein [Akanthomyces lecanii RCEF 1005]
MSLAHLPGELLLEISDHVDDLATLSRLSRCNSWLFSVLEPRLYQYSHERADSIDMKWAMEHNKVYPFRRRLAYNLPWFPDRLSCLYGAADRGSDRVLDFVLESSKKLPWEMNKILEHPLIVASVRGHLAAVQVLLHHATAEYHQQRRIGTEAAGAGSLRHSLATSFRGALDQEQSAIARELAASVIVDREVFDLVDSRYVPSNSDRLPSLDQQGSRAPSGATALYIAALQSELDCVEVLLQAGANPILDAGPRNGTPLGIVATSLETHTELLRTLLAAAKAFDTNFAVRGGLLTIPDGHLLKEHKKLLMGDALEFAVLTPSPLLRAWVLAIAIRHGDLQAVGVLLKSNANIKLQIGRCTAVEHAIENDQIAIVNVLVGHCPEALIQGSNGTTALQFAAIHNKAAICELLLKQYCVDVNCPSLNERQTTALHEAVRMNHPLMVLLLLQSGANIHAKEQGGYTPLHVCAMFSDERMAVPLLEHGADVRAVTDEKLTALQVAQKCGSPTLMRPALLSVLSRKRP